MTPKKDEHPEEENLIGTIIEVTIRKPKNEKKIAEKKEKALDRGIVLIRLREMEKNWFTHKYRIPLANLGLGENADKKEILDRLNDPKSVAEKNTREIIAEFSREYDGVVFDGKFNRTQYRTKRFKPHAKTMQVKRKAF
ncbi:MAG: hypothetical protein RBG13Loki_2777 [Promethearchaeota archaeon CR_4]|nr:MAG: hypothetical protein RBG13Loki_2777 [Candidatus Lokiarchaeota archaeon CR_4]